MNEHPLPMFDEPPVQAEPAPPKKPRPKPTRKRRTRKVVKAAPIKRRKRRAIKAKPVEQHHGGRFTREQYRLIGDLMLLTQEEREVVFEIASELTK
jgi:hypothetical protein